MAERQPSAAEKEPPPWREAAVVFAAMVISGIITVSISLKILGEANVIDKSTREPNPKPLREPLPIPDVKVLPPRADDDGDTGP